MVVRRRLGDGETDRHGIEERWLRDRRAPRPKIGADLEDQFVVADGEGLASEQRRLRAPVGVGRGLDQGPGATLVQAGKPDGNARRRPAGHGVQNMGRQTPAGAG